VRDIANRGADIVLIAPTPGPGVAGVADCLLRGVEEVSDCSFSSSVHHQALRSAAAAEGDELVDLSAWICPSRPCAPVIGGVLVYRDATHLTNLYAISLAPQLAGFIDAAVARQSEQEQRSGAPAAGTVR
jgi:hypothetical protein